MRTCRVADPEWRRDGRCGQGAVGRSSPHLLELMGWGAAGLETGEGKGLGAARGLASVGVISRATGSCTCEWMCLVLRVGQPCQLWDLWDPTLRWLEVIWMDQSHPAGSRGHGVCLGLRLGN